MSSRRTGPAPAATGGRWSSCLDSARRPRGMYCDQLHATVLDALMLLLKLNQVTLIELVLGFVGFGDLIGVVFSFIN
jgi:hypothetical protein